MRKKKAIEILEVQKSKIESTSNFNEVWKQDTLSYIDAIFGGDSIAFKFLKSLDTGAKVTKRSEFWNEHERKESQINVDKRRIEAIQHLENLIQQIQHRGVPKNKPLSEQILLIVGNLINIFKKTNF